MAVVLLLGVLLLALTGLAGCEDRRTGVTAGDCTPRLRLGQTVYSNAGYTELRGIRFSTADQAGCEDTGPSPRGSVFSEQPEQVQVLSLPGYSSDEVVAVPFDGDLYAVYVVESLAPEDVDRIVAELSPSR